jgi:AcrR family transcriptional regulator
MSRQIPRKVPQQARSQRMVERILDSCAEMLVAYGYDGVSTHRIAVAAGISPGSVYQYFPNKDAIVAVTVERMINKVAAELLEVLKSSDVPSPDDRVRAVVSAALESTERNGELVRVLVEQMPRLGGSSEIRAVEQRAGDLAVGYLASLTGDVDPVHPPAVVWMAFQTMQQLTIRYVLDRPPIPREEFLDELCRLLSAYMSPVLSGGAPISPKPQSEMYH